MWDFDRQMSEWRDLMRKMRREMDKIKLISWNLTSHLKTTQKKATKIDLENFLIVKSWKTFRKMRRFIKIYENKEEKFLKNWPRSTASFTELSAVTADCSMSKINAKILNFWGIFVGNKKAIFHLNSSTVEVQLISQ